MIRIRGFTLVELLVVISIIGILASIVAVNANSARRQSRDSKRKTDIQNVAGAIELYRATNHTYPVGVQYGASLRQVLSSPVLFLADVPTDPSGAPDGNYSQGGYYYFSDGSKFVLDVTLEGSASDTISPALTEPENPSNQSFYRTGIYNAAGKAHYRVSGP